MGGEPACFNLPLDIAVTAYLGLGTNVGERARNLHDALQRIAGIARVDRCSSVYESEPVGYAQQADFWNVVVQISTDLPARQLMDELLAIENAMGRQRSFRNAPRIIDIDILLYDDVVLKDAVLQIPHARMRERGFVVRPLLEIAPDVVDPQTRRPIAELIADAQFERLRVIAPPIQVEHETS